jgi:DNA-binding MarR family transcriptional regulator
MVAWTFITRHGLVLNYLAKNPGTRVRDIAQAVGVTNWTVSKILRELERAGYIKREKVGRKNSYQVVPSLRLRHATVRDTMVHELLGVLRS